MESKQKPKKPSTKDSKKDQKGPSGKTTMTAMMKKAAGKLSSNKKSRAGIGRKKGVAPTNDEPPAAKEKGTGKRSAAVKGRRAPTPKRAAKHHSAPPDPDYFKKQPQQEDPQAFYERIVERGCTALIEEYNGLREFIPNDFAFGTFKQHPDKNRYKDVVCNEKTRVVLLKEPQFTHDYIHANFVSTDATPNKFICTQAPNALTAVDFWRLVWQEQAPHIIMLCCVVEAGKPKCHQYWPMLAGDQVTISPFTITNKCMLPRIDEKKSDEEKSKETVVSMRLTLTKADDPNERQITHHQWTSWPDKGVPSDLRMAAYLLDAINGSQHVVIHCSAGIGRTGTLAALDFCIERLEKKVKLDVPDVVKKVRTARMYSVQTKMQYVFLHMVLLEHCRLKGWVKPGAAQPSGKYDEMVAEYAELVAKEQAARPETQPTPDDGILPP